MRKIKTALKQTIQKIYYRYIKRCQRIVIAGGCFWGVEGYFRQLKGVVKTTVGYVNGNMRFPSYEDIKKNKATHAEGCEIYYHPKMLSLDTILHHMFRFIDPCSLNKQGEDQGIQYRTGVYYNTNDSLLTIEQFIASKQYQYQALIQVEVAKEKHYDLAERYHQDYLIKNPNGYCHVSFDLIQTYEKK